MSREYMVLLVDEPEDGDVDDMAARVYMRFTEEPRAQYLEGLAAYYPGKRVYCLMGASTWYFNDGKHDD